MKSTKLICLKTKRSSNIFIEVESSGKDAIAPAGIVSKAVDNTVDTAVSKISEIAGTIASLDLPKNVKQAVIELGFQFDSRGTVYVVSSAAAATIKLSLTVKFDE